MDKEAETYQADDWKNITYSIALEASYSTAGGFEHTIKGLPTHRGYGMEWNGMESSWDSSWAHSFLASIEIPNCVTTIDHDHERHRCQ
jgi:hypothetical protein